jgi:SHS2 domain-containing protein
MSYEILEHSADAMVRVYGRTLGELFTNSALAAMDILTDRSKVAPRKSHRFSAQGATPEELLVHWLQEILYVVETKRFLFAEFTVDSIDGGKVEGSGKGEEIDFAKHDLYTVIKAVTYHNLKIQTQGDKLMVEIVFDI